MKQEEIDRLPLGAKLAWQNFQKGYLLVIDHDKKAALFRHATSGSALECGYRHAMEAQAALADLWPGRIIEKGTPAQGAPPGEAIRPSTDGGPRHKPAKAAAAAETTMTTTTTSRPIELERGRYYTAPELSEISGADSRRFTQLHRRTTFRYDSEAGRNTYRADERLVRALKAFGADVVLIGAAFPAEEPPLEEPLVEEPPLEEQSAGAALSRNGAPAPPVGRSYEDEDTGEAGKPALPAEGGIGDGIDLRLPENAEPPPLGGGSAEEVPEPEADTVAAPPVARIFHLALDEAEGLRRQLKDLLDVAGLLAARYEYDMPDWTRAVV